MATLAMVVASILVVFLGYTVLAPVAMNFSRFAGTRVLACPHLGRDGSIHLEPFSAAIGAAYGEPNPKISDCNLWSSKLLCDQKCLEGQQF